jgi:3D (Asp-Asp-Asp) domain-containing protein
LVTFVAFEYAQTRTEYIPIIANDSHVQFNTKYFNSEVINTKDNKDGQKGQENKQDPVIKKNTEENKDQSEDQDQKKESKKLVEKTGSSRAVGASRGSFVATAYCLRGKTASGANVRNGIIAADPRVLPLGTKVNLNAGAHSGNYLVADTGGKIKGKKIDIWMASCADARRFGRRTVTINVP